MQEKPTIGHTLALLQNMIFDISDRIRKAKAVDDRLIRYTIPQSVMMIDDLKTIMQWFVNVLNTLTVKVETNEKN